MKPISLTRADFKKTATDKYYIDKTNLISEMIKSDDEAFLFCRPRRFGKTLNMSMLYYFFSNQENSQELFKNLNVSKDKTAMSHLNKYPTIFLSLKDLGETLEEFQEFIKKKLIKLVKEFQTEISTNEDLCTLAKMNKETRKKLELLDVTDTLEILLDCLYKYYGEQVIILIDEYDNAIHKGVAGGYQKEVLSFLRNLLSPVTKDNNKVKLIAFTGILRITKESLFSGMNNLNVCDILENDYAEFFGLTDIEIKNTLNDFNQLGRYPEIKKWYNGYIFGETLIYNPWSTLKSIRSKKCEQYWRNTASEEMIENTFLYSDQKSKMDVLNIYENGFIIINVNLQMTLDKDFSCDIISLLLASGYLKVTKKIDRKKFRVEIVNEEIKCVYEDLLIKYVNDNSGFDEFKINQLVNAFKIDDLEDIENALQKISKNIHYLQKGYEASYHATLFAILSLSNEINVKSEVDTGTGRIDIVIYFKSHKCLIEIKRCSKANEIEGKFEEIIKQMNKRDYKSSMDKNDTLYGIVFANDSVEVKIL